MIYAICITVLLLYLHNYVAGISALMMFFSIKASKLFNLLFNIVVAEKSCILGVSYQLLSKVLTPILIQAEHP